MDQLRENLAQIAAMHAEGMLTTEEARQCWRQWQWQCRTRVPRHPLVLTDCVRAYRSRS